MNMPALDRLENVLACVTYFGASVLPIWGISSAGVCDCPKKSECLSPGKHPVSKLVSNGVNGASKDPSMIRQWARSYPNANWAMRTGDPMPGGGFLAVLDEDPRNGSEESITSFPDLPDTCTQTSGGAGRHRLFRFPHRPASRTVGPGLDLQGGGKYIVIAPSQHHTGGFYHWALGEGPGEIDVPDAPEWLVEGTGDHTPRPDRDNENTAVQTVLGELFKLAGRGGAVMPSGQQMANCPNSENHGDVRGRGEDTSCVLLPPAGGSQFGGFKCMHSSCANLKWHDILKMMPDEMVRAAQKKYPPRLVNVNATQAPAPTQSVDPSEPYKIVKDAMSWKTTKTGYKPIADFVNVITVLTYDPRWIGVLKFDEFSQVLRFTKEPPWHPDDKPKNQSPVWTDEDATCMDAWMRRIWGIEVPIEKIRAAAYTVAKREACNPLKDWLGTLSWDGTQRIDTWLTRYIGVTDSPYVRSVARKWLISAVARGMTPGCKADHVLIMEGGQGVGKSTALRTLCGQEFFSDSKIDIGNKDSFVSLRGRWIIELAELASLSRTESDQSKAFFSSGVDSYRPPYGRELVSVPRSCVFAGSTNAGQYLNDESGGRRYWPVKVGVIDIEGLVYDREQLWAEAVQAFKSGEIWWPTYAELPLFEHEQLIREVGDSWEESIAPWLHSSQAKELLARQGYLTLMQIAQFALQLNPNETNHASSIRIGRVLNHFSWKKERLQHGGSRTTVFIPKK